MIPPPQLMSSFSAEVGLMTKLHHPHILTFYGACTKPPNLLMLTEWMGRGDLFEVIGNPHSPFQRFCLHTRFFFFFFFLVTLLLKRILFRLKMVEECIVGLCYLHSLVPPVVHRDMKSMNLVIFHLSHFFLFFILVSSNLSPNLNSAACE